MSRRGMYRAPLASNPKVDPLSALKARMPVGISGLAQPDVSQLLNSLKNQQIQKLGISVPTEDASIDGKDVEGVSDVISRLKAALKDFKTFEIKTVRSPVNYNNYNVPGYEIRVVMRLVSEEGKAQVPAALQPSAIQNAMEQMKTMSPEQLQLLAAQGAQFLQQNAPAGTTSQQGVKLQEAI
jgi:hypothetical protein